MRRILSYLTNFKVKIYKNKRKSKPLNLLKWFFRGALKTAAKNTACPVNNIEFSGRPNEFGNIVANLFAVECKKLGLEYEKPRDTKGKAKESGYPDGLIKFENAYFYVEVKSCEESKQSQTLRTFFYSPSSSSKIAHDAAHLLVCFLTKKDKFKLLLNGEFHIIDMSKKDVKLKLEYNASNKELYAG